MKWKLFFLLIPLCLSGLEQKGSIQWKELNQRCKSVLKKRGSIIIIDIKDGYIKVMVNKSIAIKKSAAPGSVFKIITAIAALRKDKRNRFVKVYCDDKYYIIGKGIKNYRIHFNRLKAEVGQYYRCSKYGGHKRIGFLSALGKSCNYYFFNLGDKIGYEAFYKQAINLGFGQKVFPTFKEEISGSIKKEKLRTRQLLSYIGDGYGIQTTPLQMAHFVYFLANNGKKQIITLERNERKYRSRKAASESNYDSIIKIIKRGLIQKVSTSTDPIYQKQFIGSFAGKTGTSGAINRSKTSGWFIGYGPIRNPKVAFVIFLNEGTGKKALELAEKIFMGKNTNKTYK